MSRLALASALGLGVGAVLLLGQLRWFRRAPLAQRLAPFVPGAGALSDAARGDGGSWSAVLGPWARTTGARLSRLLGVEEDLALRLRRLHADVDPTTFRLRQLGWSALAFGVGTVLAAATGPPLPIAALLTAGAGALAFLLVERQLSAASAQRQERLLRELPVICEQLGMLLRAGYSLGAALDRLARRSSGVCAEDLRHVTGRIRQGLDETAALREWADVAAVPALHRVVGVLALNRQAGDLGRLIGEEARSIRRDAHRTLVEAMERRAQQVWIPVTVATLVPGAILLAIPFAEALRLFSET